MQSKAREKKISLKYCSACVYEGHCLFFHCLWPHLLLFYFLPSLLCSIFHHKQHVQLPRLVSGKHPSECHPLTAGTRTLTLEGNMLCSTCVGKERLWHPPHVGWY